MHSIVQLDQKLLNTPLRGGDSFDFSAVERNLALNEVAKKTGDQPCVPKVTSTGTTIVASLFKDGVMLGADSRSTMGNLISNKNSIKLHYLTDLIYAAGAGTAADLEKVSEMVSSELELFELNNEGKKARVVMAHRRLRQYLFQYQGYVGAYLLIAGCDATGPHLFEVSATGSGFTKVFSADGSGSYCAIAEMETRFKPDMTEDECRKMLVKALEAGMHGDNMSGNSYYLSTITKNGLKSEGPFVPSFSVRNELELDYTFKSGVSTVLKSKFLECLDTTLAEKVADEKMETC